MAPNEKKRQGPTRTIALCTWASSDFFHREGKIFQGEPGGGKMTKKDTIFLKKKSKTYFLPNQGGKRAPLDPCPVDTHDK